MRHCLFCLLALGCSSSKDAANGDDTPPGGSGDADTDTDTDADTGTGTHLADGDRLGIVELISSTPTDPVGLYGLFYEFDVSTVPADGTGTVTAGDCWFEPASTVGYTSTFDEVTFDAGDVAATLGSDSYSLPFGSPGFYLTTLPSWPEGEELGFSATGGDFPAFSFASLLTVPAAIAPEDEPARIDTGADLALGWGGTSDASVDFLLTTGEGQIFCSFADTGSGVVPAELLGLAGTGDASASLERFAFGDYVEVDATTEVVALAASSVSWTPTLQ